MSQRTFFVGILALVCGVSASVGVNRLRPKSVQAKPDVVAVPVAAVAIKRGDKVTEAMLIDKQWPKTLVPSGAVLKRDQIVGKIAKVPLVKGEPMFGDKLGDTPRFSGLVKEGMRAYTILTPNDSSLVAGLIEPGDKVDVLFTDNTDRKMTGGGSTAPIMQNIEVMAIGQIIDPSDGREKTGRQMRSVTMAVPLEMAAVLALAQEMGTLHLALRSEQDEATAEVSAVTVSQLLNTAYPPDQQPVPHVSAKVVAADVIEDPKQPSQIAVRALRGSMRSTLIMRSAGQRGSLYIDDGSFQDAAPSPDAPATAPALGVGEGSVQ